MAKQIDGAQSGSRSKRTQEPTPDSVIYRTAEELLISTDAQILKLAIRRNRPDFRLGLQLEYDLRQAREELRAKIECEVHPLVCA